MAIKAVEVKKPPARETELTGGNPRSASLPASPRLTHRLGEAAARGLIQGRGEKPRRRPRAVNRGVETVAEQVVENRSTITAPKGKRQA